MNKMLKRAVAGLGVAGVAVGTVLAPVAGSEPVNTAQAAKTSQVCNFADPYTSPNLTIRYTTGARGVVPAGQCSNQFSSVFGFRPPVGWVARYRLASEKVSTHTCTGESSWVFCGTFEQDIVVTSMRPV